MGKKVLLFAEHFAPEATPSAVRPTKLAKFLTASGYSVTVVTKRRVLQTDELLRQDLKSCGRIYRAMPRGDLKAARPIRSKADDPGKGGNLFSRLLRAIRRTLSAIRAAGYEGAVGLEYFPLGDPKEEIKRFLRETAR